MKYSWISFWTTPVMSICIRRSKKYFLQHQPPLLAVWGNGDPFFVPAGAEAFKRDITNATVTFFDTGHFALETHCDEIALAIRAFLSGVDAKTPRGDEYLREA
jgi:pimeloyl-ACP methyl ester carboxylesterase